MTSIIAIYRRFPTKESCIEHLEAGHAGAFQHRRHHGKRIGETHERKRTS